MVQIKSFVFNPFQENTYVLSDETSEGIIVDPGCFDKGENEELKQWIKEKGISIKAVYNTHCHIDHVLGNDYCKNEFKVELIIPKGEADIYRAVKVYAANYGIHGYKEADVDRYLTESDKIHFGNTILDILFIPGHAPGHLIFFNKKEKFCIAGDVLFQRSIGRTDLPGGDHDTLISNIKNKMFKLDDAMIVYPGHGPSTSIGEEKKFNPFVGLNA